MKAMKRMGALLLVLAMVLALGVSAFASGGTDSSSNNIDGYSITIQNSSKDKEYSAYQILDVTYDGNGNVAYTITPGSVWFYTIWAGSNLNGENSEANTYFTLVPVYEAGYTPGDDTTNGDESHVDYYSVQAAGLTDGNATDPIIDYLLTAIHMITEGSDEGNLDTDGNEKSTGLAWITAYKSDGSGETENVLLIPAGASADNYADMMTKYDYSRAVSAAATRTGSGASITIDLDKPGYYFITTTTGTTISVTTADPTATIIDKNIIPGSETPPPGDNEPGDGTPWLDKYIVVSSEGTENEDDEYEYDYAMGDPVHFHVTSDVPLYADSNKENPSDGEDKKNNVNNAELVYEYVFTDAMKDGVNLIIAKELVNADNTEQEGSESSYVYVKDGRYYLTDYALDKWITITDGSTEWDEGAQAYVPTCTFTQVTYNYFFELTDFTPVYFGANYAEDGKYTTDVAGALYENGEPSIAYYVATGFTLTYYTYDVDAYFDHLWNWVYEVDEETGQFADLEDRVSCLTSGSYPEEVLAAAWEVAYSGKSVEKKYPATAEILIEYDAVMSDAAVYKNTNTVTLEYYVVSWDSYPPVPGVPEEDIPEDPDPDKPPEPPTLPDIPDKEKTPGTHSGQSVSNDIFTWELEILKIADDDAETALEGAVFTLKGDALDRVKVTTYTYTLVKDFNELSSEEQAEYETDKQYYLLADPDAEGNEVYVTEAPTSSNSSKYAEGEAAGPYYRKSDYVMEHGDTSNFYAEGTTDAKGNLTFSGLKEGTYTLTEIVAPDGYNILSEPIYFTVNWFDAGEKYPTADGSTTTSNNPVFVIAFTDADGNTLQNENETYQISTVPVEGTNATYTETIVNNAGQELPGTGGIGTTIFYIIGACLVAGAVVVLVTRRRVSKGEKA